MTVRLAIRGFVGKTMKFEDLVELDEEKLDSVLVQLGEKHARAMAAHELHMIEIEFLDEPDVSQRFFRFGSDPSAMKNPIAVETGDFENVARNLWGKPV